MNARPDVGVVACGGQGEEERRGQFERGADNS